MFFYKSSDIDNNRKITLRVQDKPLTEVLTEILKGTEATFSIKGEQIIISSPPPPPSSSTTKVVELRGFVLDGDSKAVVGAAVLVKGTNKGAMTDVDGSFTLVGVSGDATLVVSCVGYTQQEVAVDGRSQVAVVLREQRQSEIDEVVVVAFGKQKKESVVGSVTTVKPSELKVPSSNLTTALAGKISGIISYQRSGEPGQDNAEFFIRGVTTFGSGKKNPLILIDGVELSADDLSRLNTDDIASFSVMKDATATSLYGARGANGVILITTKGGVEGETKLSIRFENSFSMSVRDVQLADPITYMNLNNEAVRTRDPLGIIPFSNEKIANTGTGNPYVYPAVDWGDMLFKDYTVNRRFNASISGGGKAAKYYVAASYDNDNGMLDVDKRNNFNNNISLDKYLLRANVNLNLTKTTEMVVRLHGTFDDYSGPIDGASYLYNRVMRADPVRYPAYYEPDEKNKDIEHIMFGNADNGGYVNPYADMVRGYKEYSKTLVLAQIELNQNLDFLLEGLSARGTFNTTRYSYFDVQRYYEPFYYKVGSYDKYTDTYRLTALNENSGTEWLNYSEGKKDVSSTLYYEVALQYNHTFAEDHNVSALLVTTGRDELKGNTGSLQLSLPYRNLGLAGRLTYAYGNKYFVEGNFGYNGSERFAAGERFGFFPSAGLGYMVSNEAFWEPLKETISMLKLKATIGLVGNDAIGSENDRFFYLSEVNLNDENRGMSFGTEYGYRRNGVSTSRYEDPYITWEVAYKRNYGVEIGLFEKVEIQADYFREHRTNILQNRTSIPTTMGLQRTPQSNIGESEAHGFEMSLDYSHSFSSDFWLSARGNFTYATAKYKVYEEPDYGDMPWRSQVGQKLSQWSGLIAERLFMDEADVSNSPKQTFGEYGAGDIKYKDINMDDVIDDRDKVALGYPTDPEIIYGFGFSLGYKSFDISAFFQGSALSSFWISYWDVSPFVDHHALMQAVADDYWSEDNRDPNAFWPRLSDRGIDNNNQTSTWFMRDGAFVRLKNAEIGYTLPRYLSNKIRMSSARVYVNGTNLLTFSKFDLWDPEMGGNGLGYPVQRVFNVGINLSF
jgi:TonB-linked SusC/RagA family outer membrane protein